MQLTSLEPAFSGVGSEAFELLAEPREDRCLRGKVFIQAGGYICESFHHDLHVVRVMMSVEGRRRKGEFYSL
jgi:hypothetical protein